MGCPTVYEVYMLQYIVGFCVVITIYVGGHEVGCPTVYEGYTVRYGTLLGSEYVITISIFMVMVFS